MKIDLTSVKAFERSLAKLGLHHYGTDNVQHDIKEADRLGLIKCKMRKSRLFARLKLLKGNK